MAEILIVDDSETDHHLYARAFRNLEDQRLTQVLTATEGLEKAKTGGFDALIVDYNMPDMNGIEFMKTLATPDLPVIMLTGLGNEAVAVEAMKLGAADYLVKEMDGRHLKLLPATVERVLRESAARKAQKAAEMRLALAASVFDAVSEAIMTTDADGNIISVNPGFCAMTGYSADEMIGRNPRVIKSNRHDAAFFSEMWQTLVQTGRWQGEVWNRRKDGSLFLARETITAIRDEQGHIQHYAAVQIDITEARQKEESVRHMAYHDELTGLPNRALFMDRLRQELAHAHRHGRMTALLLIDLDKFKPVNDTLGHDIGDLLLKETAMRLKACTREADTVARLGGDEFTIVLDDLKDQADAEHVAAMIVSSLSHPFRIKEHSLSISGSVGIALYPKDGITTAALIKHADIAMYQAKQRSKSGFVFFGADG